MKIAVSVEKEKLFGLAKGCKVFVESTAAVHLYLLLGSILVRLIHSGIRFHFRQNVDSGWDQRRLLSISES